jgi:hypothetical protein
MSIREAPLPGGTIRAAVFTAMLAVLPSSLLAQGQERNDARAEATREEWRLQHPIVVTSEEMGPRVRFLNLFPMGIVWLDNEPVAAVVKDPKVSPVLMFWKEHKDRSWAPYAEIPGIRFPRVFSIQGKAIGAVGSAGEDVTGGYGNAIHFVRIQNWKTGRPHVLSPSSEDGTRVTVSTVEVSGDTIFVFLLREARGNPRNDLLFAMSQDGGLSWSDTKKIGDTTMHEDSSHVRALCFSNRHVARFVCEQEGVFLYRTRDAGKTWKKEPFTVQDDLAATRRLPLGRIISRDGPGVVYLAHNPQDQREGKYFYTRSSDQGKSWSKGVPITKNMKLDDPSTYVQVACVGTRIAFSYMESVGNWSEGEIENHIVVSQDNGKTWAQEPLNKYYNGVMLFSALSGAPDGSRLIYNTAIRAKKDGASRCYLVVQEYSGRMAAEEATAVIKRFVADLGHKEHKVRQAASERLATLGASARKELLKAAENEDPEVALRARALIELLFPECLKLEIEK